MTLLQLWHLLISLNLTHLWVQEFPTASCARLLNSQSLPFKEVLRLCRHPRKGLCTDLLLRYAYPLTRAQELCAQNPKRGSCVADLLDNGWAASKAEEDCQRPSYGHCLSALSTRAYTGLNAQRLCRDLPAKGPCMSLLFDVAYGTFESETLCQRPELGPCLWLMAHTGHGKSYSQAACERDPKVGACFQQLSATAYSDSEKEILCGLRD